jgi:hypothetical protein
LGCSESASLLVLKMAALALVGTLATIVLPGRHQLRTRLAVAAVLIVVAVIAPPDQHDLVLGNVMALYVGAVALSVAVPGWVGAAPLGLVLALALKPVIGPYLVWLLLRRAGDFARTAAVAVVVTAAVALVVGVGRYGEYLAALPRMSILAQLPTGNVGLTTISLPVAVAGVAVAYVVTFAGARRLVIARSAAVAIAAGLLAQPTIGFNYVGLLIPAAVTLWSADRVAGFIAFVTVPVAAIISPPFSAGIMIGLSFAPISDWLGISEPSPRRVPG